MLLKPVSDGSVVGTGTLTFESTILGGVLITANGTNDTTVTMQANNSSGSKVFEIVTKSPIFVAGPISLGVQAGYYAVSGTGSGAQFYEWVE
jgi:hypothetical protein